MKEDDHRCRKDGNGQERRRKGRSLRRAGYSDGEWEMTRVKHTPSLSATKKRVNLKTEKFLTYKKIVMA